MKQLLDCIVHAVRSGTASFQVRMNRSGEIGGVWWPTFKKEFHFETYLSKLRYVYLAGLTYRKHC